MFKSIEMFLVTIIRCKIHNKKRFKLKTNIHNTVFKYKYRVLNMIERIYSTQVIVDE